MKKISLADNVLSKRNNKANKNTRYENQALNHHYPWLAKRLLKLMA